MSFPKYGEYKDSGVEWLGQVPLHWKLVRLKDIAEVVNGFPFDSKLFEADGAHALVRIRDLDSRETATRYSGDFIPAAAVTPSDVLIGMDGDFNVGRWLGSETALLNQRMCCVRANNSALSTFLLHALPTPLKAINNITYSTTVKHLSSLDVEKILFALPDGDELTAIAAFLDRETVKIDALIAEQEKLIALLAEKRQATISHAVTRGLNPNAPMKDSGVAWLGEVPAHWEITQLKRLCERITDGAHVSPETEGGLYSFISTKDLDDDAIDFEGCLLTSPSSYEYLERTGCKPSLGDVLFSKDGTIGRTVVVRDEREFVVASSLIIITPHARILDSDFLNYLCKSSAVSSQVERFVKGAGLPRLSIQNLLKVVGVFPPIEEQRSISAYLKAEIQKTDIFRAEAEQAIALLKERRSALITAAVTGQIDVRGLVEAQPS